MNRFFLIGFFVLIVISFTFADSMWYDFTNDYAVDGNGKLNVYLDASDDGVPDAGYDVNLTVHIGDTNFILSSETGSDGYASFNFDFNYDGLLNVD